MADDDLSEDHILAIGRLVVAVTRLESLILDFLRIFLMTRSVVRVIAAFSHQQVSSNIATAKALYSLGSEKEDLKGDRVLELLDRVKDIADFRNTVVHAYWSIDADGKAHAVRYQARGFFTRSRRPIESAEIHAKADEAAQLEQTLRGLRDHLLSENPELFSEGA